MGRMVANGEIKNQSGVRNMESTQEYVINKTNTSISCTLEDLEGRLWQKPAERETRGSQKGRAH